MFSSFNSLEIYTAFSLEEQGALRSLLDEAGIEHSVSAMDINAPRGFYPVLSPELLMTQSIHYIFYIHKRDRQAAATLLKERWSWEEEQEVAE